MLIKIKISITYVYKDYEVKTKMVHDQCPHNWLIREYLIWKTVKRGMAHERATQ